MAMMMITIIIFMIVMIMNMFSFNFIHKKSTLSDKDDKEDKIIFNIVLVHHNQHNDDQTANLQQGLWGRSQALESLELVPEFQAGADCLRLRRTKNK